MLDEALARARFAPYRSTRKAAAVVAYTRQLRSTP